MLPTQMGLEAIEGGAATRFFARDFFLRAGMCILANGVRCVLRVLCAVLCCVVRAVCCCYAPAVFLPLYQRQCDRVCNDLVFVVKLDC